MDIMPSIVVESSTSEMESLQKTKRLKCIKTALFYYSFIAMGSVSSIVGPTILSLAEIAHVGAEEIGIIFTFRAIGNIIGSLGSGVLMDRYSQKLPILILFSIGMAVSNVCIPFCTTLLYMDIVILVTGMCIGGFNNGINVCLLQVWGNTADSFFLALHFSYGVGAFLAPIISAQFLKREPLAPVEDGYPIVVWVYVIVSCLVLLAVCSLAIYFVIVPEKTDRPSSQSSPSGDEGRLLEPGRLLLAAILILTAAATFSTSSIESGYNAMISTYAVEGLLSLNKQKAALLNAAFWGAYMTTRFVCIFVAKKLSPRYLISFDIVTLIVSSLILIVFGGHNEIGLWIGSVGVGLGIATLFPCGMSWIGKHIKITFKIGSLFFFMGSVSELIWPAVLGSFVTSKPMYLYFHVFFAAIGCLLLYGVLDQVFKRKLRVVE